MTTFQEKNALPREEDLHPLPPLSRLVLHACALIGEPQSRDALLAFLLRPEMREAIRPAQKADLEESLNRLLADDFLRKDLLVPPALQEVVARQAMEQAYFLPLVAACKKAFPALGPDENTDLDALWQRTIRDLRLALYLLDETAYTRNLLRLLEMQEQFPRRFPENPMLRLCGLPFAAPWFKRLPLHIQFYALNQIFINGLLQLGEPRLPTAYLEDKEFLASLPAGQRDPFYYLLISELLLRGDDALASAHLDALAASGSPLGLRGWREFMAGNNRQAIESYETDLAQIRKGNQNEQAYFTGIEGFFYLLALLKDGSYLRHAAIKKAVADVEALQPHNPFLPAYALLLAVVAAKENRLDLARERLLAARQLSRPHSITILVWALASYWIEGKPADQLLPQLRIFQKKAARHGYCRLAEEYATLLGLASGKTKAAEPAPESLASAVKPEEQWQRALRALNFTSGPAQAQTRAEQQYRLAWLLAHEKTTRNIAILPKVQSLSARQLWTKGRAIALRKLFRKKRPAFLSLQDVQVSETIEELRDSRGVFYQFATTRAMHALIGHPHVFLAESPRTPVEILKGEPELRVDQQEDSLHVRFYPPLAPEEITIIRETPVRFKVYPIGEEHRRVALIIGDEGLRVPVTGREELFATLGNISSFMTVHSTIDGRSAGIDEVTADSRIHMQLLPYGTGFRLAMLVKPLHPEGPYQKPGEGPKTIIAQLKDKRVQTKRDLNLEEENARSVEESCPMLVAAPDLEREWILQDPEECLQLLLELQALPESVLIEWPEGEKLTVSPPAELNQILLNIREHNNWFEMSGSLKLDDSLVLDMRKLLDLAQTTASRFIPLGHGHFLTLSRELRRRLDEIAAFSEFRKNSIRLHPLAALALEDFTSGVGRLEVDARWREQERRLAEAQEYEPLLPSTFKAQLRDYQLVGFQWLARLAGWGVGACLADDMGLGKTVQALALILDRASRGPTLVVAPTSVCPNWQEEANRFAPTLNVIMFGGRYRKELVSELKPFDLMIASYGLLQQETTLLATQNWQTIVLDEAQAIKNFITKRSRAAMQLQGEFKMLTTGTPIENHLPELWTLFQFINPGLLGSLNQFSQRFAIPIERHNDPEAKRRLKRLINPFILRRLKAQVLEELPARTEILLQVEMEEKEAAFYAALRQQALEKLQHGGGPPGKRSLQILAEIMRLRRACCNPRLIVPETDIPSAKLALFAKLVSELRENGHKALVFSQFVDHLALIRAHLDREGFSYQYMDGNTPSRDRQQQVQAFQAGRGDLFLISLKAGGLGLNLTAADYVIHMDPWWNPAVEDQASDRAHRIGQQHPVTIYRLVAKNTIEEKIVQLHQEKRDLAESLLEGSDVIRAVNSAELLRLLRES
ncbi:DEAD/DEAH box helicase [Thiovibrio sp. JS02]